MTEPQTLAAHLPNLGKAMVSAEPSAQSVAQFPTSAMKMLRGLPERLNDEQYELAKTIAASPIPALRPANLSQFENFMSKISTLPRKVDDDDTAQERVKIYGRMLGHLSPDELGYLVRRAMETCRWMPTVAECLDILKGWKRNDEPMQAHLLAKTMCQRERQARFEAVMGRLARREMDQDEIDALPAPVKEMAEVRSYLWRCDCGSYVARPLPVIASEVAA